MKNVIDAGLFDIKVADHAFRTIAVAEMLAEANHPEAFEAYKVLHNTVEYLSQEGEEAELIKHQVCLSLLAVTLGIPALKAARAEAVKAVSAEFEVDCSF